MYRLRSSGIAALLAGILLLPAIAFSQATMGGVGTGPLIISSIANGNSGGPPHYANSTPSRLVQNVVAGKNSNVPAALQGTSASTTYSLTSNVATINVPNSFGVGANLAVSGASSAPFNGLILTTNTSTNSTQVVGTLRYTDKTPYTHADISSTADTTIYLQAPGWQPSYLAPFPAHNNAYCPGGNGSPGCAAPPATGGALSGINTFAFDFMVPGASGADPVNAIVQLTDAYTFGSHVDCQPSKSGETNDYTISLSDGAGGYFYSCVQGGGVLISHGHMTLCAGSPCFVTDVTSSAGMWSPGGGSTNYGAFSRNPTNAPGVNKALFYDVDYSTNPYAPFLEARVLTYSAGAVTSGTPTVPYAVQSCPGWPYVDVASGDSSSDAMTSTGTFNVDNNDNMVQFSLGSGPQNGITRHTIFAISLANNTCANADTAGFSGTGLYSVRHHGSGTGTGAKVNDILTFQSFYTTCTGTVKVTSIGTGGSVTGESINTSGAGCSLGSAFPMTDTTTPAATGITIDVGQIGTPGSFACIYPPVAPFGGGSCHATTTAAFGLHNSHEDASGTYSKSGFSWQMANTNVYPIPGACNGHPASGWLSEGCDSFPNYWRAQLPYSYPSCPDPNCINLFGNWEPTNQGHSTTFSPHNDQTYPFIVTTSQNVACTVKTDPPGWTTYFGNSLFLIMQDSLLAAPDTRWIMHQYENTCNKTESFQALNSIIACAPDGVFCIGITDANANFAGNTGMGADNNSAPFEFEFSVTPQ